jgi:hypothetical protein
MGYPNQPSGHVTGCFVVEAIMADQTAADAKKQYVQRMGEALGTQFHALWQETTLLHVNWKECHAVRDE